MSENYFTPASVVPTPTTGKDSIKPVEQIIYFDCYSGISGDMTLGALLDCGVDLASLQELLKKLNLSGYRLESEKVTRGGIAGTKALVQLEDNSPVERHLSNILEIIDQSDLPQPVCQNSSAVFRRLAEAEAAVHGIAVEKVHFHEVGALDAIIDIVGTCAALYLLKVDRIYCSPLPASRGEIMSAHGRLPLPAPATLELLTKRQVPIEGHDSNYEMVTPTGAAIVTALADSFGPLNNFNIESVGYGAGSIDPGHPNYLRLLYGYVQISESGYEEKIIVIEANIDDLNPEIYGYLMEKLFAAGALDVYFTPVQMKKNRPGVQLTILSTPEKQKLLQQIVFTETTTLGLRATTTRKIMSARKTKLVQTAWGQVRVKYTPAQGEHYPLQYCPEYEDCQSIAEQSGLPMKEVYRLAEYHFRKEYLQE